jgi:hypothetical protein
VEQLGLVVVLITRTPVDDLGLGSSEPGVWWTLGIRRLGDGGLLTDRTCEEGDVCDELERGREVSEEHCGFEVETECIENVLWGGSP